VKWGQVKGARRGWEKVGRIGIERRRGKGGWTQGGGGGVKGQFTGTKEGDQDAHGEGGGRPSVRGTEEVKFG